MAIEIEKALTAYLDIQYTVITKDLRTLKKFLGSALLATPWQTYVALGWMWSNEHMYLNDPLPGT